jgi:RHS repeat-associated protein
VDNQTVTNDFGYNLRSEVIEALMGTNTYGYAYDPIGNRQTATNNAEVLSYIANELNQYTNITDGVTLEPVFDDDGNMVSYGDWTFTWNGENRIIAASNAAHVVTYAYDHVGRLFAKTTFEASDLGTPISDLRHIWDGFNIVRSATMSNDVVIVAEYYVWGLDLSGSLQGAGGVGGLLAVTVAGGDDPGHYVAAYDANGNITEYVDATGAIVAHREYGPFGETTALSGLMQNAFTHWWSTKPWDPITGFSEYAFRMYSPELGRWPSRDPIGDVAQRPNLPLKRSEVLKLMSMIDPEEENLEIRQKDLLLLGPLPEEQNLYMAMGNDPVTQVDPLGLECGVVVNRTKATMMSSFISINAGHEWIVYSGNSVGFWPNRNWSVIRPDPAEQAGVRVCWQWETKQLKHGKLKWGSAAGTECKCATCDQITDCLNNAPNPGWRRWSAFNNCRRFTGWALDGCCLKKGKRTTFSCP